MGLTLLLGDVLGLAALLAVGLALGKAEGNLEGDGLLAAGSVARGLGGGGGRGQGDGGQCGDGGSGGLADVVALLLTLRLTLGCGLRSAALLGTGSLASGLAGRDGDGHSLLLGLLGTGAADGGRGGVGLLAVTGGVDSGRDTAAGGLGLGSTVAVLVLLSLLTEGASLKKCSSASVCLGE